MYEDIFPFTLRYMRDIRKNKKYGILRLKESEDKLSIIWKHVERSREECHFKVYYKGTCVLESYITQPHTYSTMDTVFCFLHYLEHELDSLWFALFSNPELVDLNGGELVEVQEWDVWLDIDPSHLSGSVKILMDLYTMYEQMCFSCIETDLEEERTTEINTFFGFEKKKILSIADRIKFRIFGQINRSYHANV